MILLNGLSKRFDKEFVVKNIALTIKKGEIIGLLGPNGAGKTTTLRMLAGVLPPTQGSVIIDGIDIHHNSAIKHHIGYLPENNPLYEEMIVEEYLTFWATLKKIPQQEQKNAIDLVVKNTDIASVFYRPIHELSKGFRQRVGLSQTLLTKPAILLLDEPTEGLDPNQRRDIQQVIRQLGKNHTVIISSHVLSEVAKLCNRIVIIHKGKVVADAPPGKLKISAKGGSARGGKNNVSIEAEIKGSKIISTLKAINAVQSVREQSKDYFIIEAREDVRATISLLAAKHKWTVLTLMKKEVQLEDIFSELTSD